MDPGNWATDLAGGSKYNYTLLSVIMISNLMAILLQALSLKLGIVTGRDLAQACRDHYSRPVSFCLWVICELAIAACDLAEIIGSAIALNLLFGIPLIWRRLHHRARCAHRALPAEQGLSLHRGAGHHADRRDRRMLRLGVDRFAADLLGIAKGFIPTTQIVTDPGMLYIAIGILGATVMPHNLYLHSSIVQTRRYELNARGKREAIKFATIDSTLALMFALFINAAILIVSAATFYTRGRNDVAEIQDAYKLLSPMLGVTGASTLFALALLASGQNSTLTGTLAGQIVMEGFLNIRLRPWLRRLITRGDRDHSGGDRDEHVLARRARRICSCSAR